ncbi:uncharacterized protein LOC113312991 [Papaver somniferum]|uniref:uncharacterized protein LOC113312991 n=1 Tax=Papaver somniferum TaxID=3469 RepID=UPI000E7007BB|nr:uncharacterized protein LOC113312991 [Papaver somniferum]
MATNLVLKVFIRKLEKTIRDFWWGHSRDTRKLHHIKWDWFLISKEQGGLGLRSLEHINLALVAKLAWRCSDDPPYSTKQCILSWFNANDGGYSFCLGSCLLWAIWKARNKLHFEKIKPHIPTVINDVVYWFSIYYFAEDDVGISSQSARIVVNNPVQQVWYAPPEGTVKINVDVVVGLQKISAAAIARNHVGQFLAASTKISDHSSPMVAEAKSFLLGLKLARIIQLQDVIIEGDCLNMVNIVDGSSSFTPWRVRFLVEEIIKLAG